MTASPPVRGSFGTTIRARVATSQEDGASYIIMQKLIDGDWVDQPGSNGMDRVILALLDPTPEGTMTHPSPLVKTYRLGAGWKLIPGDPLPDERDIGPDGQEGWCLYWDVESRRDCLPGNGKCAVSANAADGVGECCACGEPIAQVALDNLGAILWMLAVSGVY